VEAANGHLIVHIRNHNAENKNETLQTVSTDGGKTWSRPAPIGVWGLPSHLLRMGNGNLVMTYGYRRQPFGNQARVSFNHGRTWSAPVAVSADGLNGDLGYPSTVEVTPGELFTLWYEVAQPGAAAILRTARYRL
jgi:hypothetical protein